MGLYPEEIVREVQDRADIVEIVSNYVSLKKRGENYVGLCPFHSEKTPSFNVSPKKQLFYCFGCGMGGNVFTFLMKKENWTFPEALRYLADKVGVKLPEERALGKVSEAFKLKRAILEINRIAAEYYHQNLLKTAQAERARRYLSNRGIREETVERFKLGYALPAWDGLINFMRSKGIREDLLLKAGLIIPKNYGKGFYDRFRDRIIFPILDVTGSVVGFGGRILDRGEPKYLNSPETPVFNKREHLYGLPMVDKEKSPIVLVEGYMDCITLHQYGFKQAVASLGTSLTEQQARILRRYTDEVAIAYDSDAAGQAATARGIGILVKEGLRVKVIDLPEGKDPDEFIKSRGKEAFEELIKSAQDYIDYRLSTAKKGLDLRSQEGKLKFVKRAVSILAEIEDGVERELYVQKVSNELNIPKNALYEDINKIRTPRSSVMPNIGLKYKNSQLRDNNKELTKISAESVFRQVERKLLRMMIEDDGVREKVMERLAVDNFVDLKHRKIAAAVFEMAENNERVTAQGVSVKLKDDPDAAAELASVLLASEEQDGEMADELINKVKENYLKLAIKKVRSEIQKAEKVGEVKKAVDLLSTYYNLKHEMEQLKSHLTRKGGI